MQKTPKSLDYETIILELEQQLKYDSSAVILLSFGEIVHIVDAATSYDSLHNAKWYSSDLDIDKLLEDDTRKKFMTDVEYTVATVSVQTNSVNEALSAKIPGSNVYSYAGYDAVFILGNAIDMIGNATDAEAIAKAIPFVAAVHNAALGDTTLNMYGDLALANYDIMTVQDGILVTISTRPVLNIGESSITVNVFHDSDKNGIRDAGEEGIPDASLTLFDPEIYTAFSDSDGTHTFENLMPKLYTLLAYHDGNVEFVHVRLSENQNHTIDIGFE